MNATLCFNHLSRKTLPNEDLDLFSRLGSVLGVNVLQRLIVYLGFSGDDGELDG